MGMHGLAPFVQRSTVKGDDDVFVLDHTIVLSCGITELFLHAETIGGIRRRRRSALTSSRNTPRLVNNMANQRERRCPLRSHTSNFGDEQAPARHQNGIPHVTQPMHPSKRGNSSRRQPPLSQTPMTTTYPPNLDVLCMAPPPPGVNKLPPSRTVPSQRYDKQTSAAWC